jgi:hypothetical protein
MQYWLCIGARLLNSSLSCGGSRRDLGERLTDDQNLKSIRQQKEECARNFCREAGHDEAALFEFDERISRNRYRCSSVRPTR